MKSIFKKGFMYKVSCNPSVIFYVSENKTLGCKEDRTYEGEASGRKLVVTFFEDVPGGLVKRIDQRALGMKLELLTLAEILLACGVVAPADPERTTAATGPILEAECQNLEIQRSSCTLQTEAPSSPYLQTREGGRCRTGPLHGVACEGSFQNGHRQAPVAKTRA